MKNQIMRVTLRRRGQGLAEYGLILVLGALIALAATDSVGNITANHYESIADQVRESQGYQPPDSVVSLLNDPTAGSDGGNDGIFGGEFTGGSTTGR